MPELEPGLVAIFAARLKKNVVTHASESRASELVAAAGLSDDTLPVAATLAVAAGRHVAMPAMVRVDEHVGKAACFFFRTVEAEQASGHHARFAVTAGDGVGQPAGRAFLACAAICRIADFHALVTAQLSVGATPLVDVGCIDDQRATQRTEPAGGDDR